MSETVHKKQPSNEASRRSQTGVRISQHSGKLLGQLKIKPHEQSRMSLGNFAAYEPFKGFSIELRPKPEIGSVITEVLNTGTNQLYKLTLFVSNNGAKSITAKIRQL